MTLTMVQSIVVLFNLKTQICDMTNDLDCFDGGNTSV